MFISPLNSNNLNRIGTFPSVCKHTITSVHPDNISSFNPTRNYTSISSNDFGVEPKLFSRTSVDNIVLIQYSLLKNFTNS